MTLADDVLAEKKRRSNNPGFTHLSGDTIALCAVLDRIITQNRLAAISVLPPAYARGAEPGVTAKPRGRKGAKES